mgnify:CR=1 FL=1
MEIPYIQAVLKEWEHYRKILRRPPLIRELHLGGGTPTFFSARNLRWLISYILDGVTVHSDFEFSFEGHPNNTTTEHLQTLHELGFSRVSLGVQDLDEKVQRTIHRIQPFENLRQVTLAAREIGYTSIGFDLIYGLPFQNPFTVSDTFEKVLTLKPDRISFFGYAHVPWLKAAQRGYSESDLPPQVLKRHLYEIGRYMLGKNDYADIGMDHFALRHDSLFKAFAAGKLHRNFMGYTSTQTDLLIGLGASAISDSSFAYAQNKKKVEDYLAGVKESGSAVFKGHVLSEEDRLLRACILQIACQGKLDMNLLREAAHHASENIMEALADMDGIRSAGGVAQPQGDRLDPGRVATNFVLFRVDRDRAAFLAALRARNVLMVEYPHGQVRAATHHDVSQIDIDTVIGATREALAETA